MEYQLGHISLFLEILSNDGFELIYLVLAIIPFFIYLAIVKFIGKGKYLRTAFALLLPFCLIQSLVVGEINYNALTDASVNPLSYDFKTKEKVKSKSLQIPVITDICYRSVFGEQYSAFRCNGSVNKAIFASLDPETLESEEGLEAMRKAFYEFATRSPKSEFDFKENLDYVSKYMPHLKASYLKRVTK